MREFLTRCRFFFIYAGVFSFFINLLMLTFPLYILQVFDRVITSRSEATLVMLTLVAAGSFLVMAVLEMMRSRLLVRAGIALDSLMSQPVLSGLLKSVVKQTNNGYTHGLRDVNQLRNFLSGHSVFAFFDSPWAPIYLIVIFLFHTMLGITALVGVLVLFGLAWLEEKATREPLNEASEQARKAGRYIDVCLRNAEVVGALGMQRVVVERWQKINNEVIRFQTLASNRAGVILSLTKFTRWFLQILMLGIGAFLVIDQHVTPGVMMAATLILGRALAPVELAISSWKGLIGAREAYHRLSQLLDKTPQVIGQMDLPAPQGHLMVDKLVFNRPEKQILRGFSFALPAGESLGIVGPTAAGKSTLARLLVGIWQPSAGAVRLDGADVSTWDHEHLGQYLGYLPQDVELFSGTVAENIARLGDAQARADDVVAAAKRAYAHEMILALPQGYDTQISEAGGGLSGGQRQRIGLARALFGDPRLVLLDEPNANLDTDGEKALMDAMREMKQAGITLIVIAHKPSILGDMDKMLVLRDGRLELFGQRQDVMARLAAPPTVGGRPAVAAIGTEKQANV